MLSQHLKLDDHGLEAAPTIRVMRALGEAVGAGFEPPRGFLLACLFADMHLTGASESGSSRLLRNCHALRACGFSRGDTEHLRSLLDALGHMLKPSRITRRLVRRPYFPLARRLFELIAPIFSADPAELDRFLAVTPQHHRASRNHSGHTMGDTGPPHRSRKRRGRRAGRRRRNTTGGPGSEIAKAEGRSDALAEAPVQVRGVDETPNN
jgi:hypothetical protein